VLTLDLLSPAELTGFVRELTFPNANALETYLPRRERASIEYAFIRSDRQRRKAAQYRPFDVESPIGDRPGIARVSGRIPPISKKMVLGEEEQLLRDALQRENLLTPEIEDMIWNDARNLTSDIQDRLEFARGQVLTTGKVTFTNDLGFETAQIDYGIPGSNFVSPAGDDWDGANPVPITDMRTWITDVYMPANSNRRPVVGLTSTKVITDLTLSDEVKSFIPATNISGQFLPILTPAQLTAVLGAQNLPPLVAVDEVVNIPGVGETRVIPEGLVVFLPAPAEQFGETTYGQTVEALNLARSGYLRADSAPGLVGENMITFDPQHYWTKIVGLALPVLKDPNAVMVATVES